MEIDSPRSTDAKHSGQLSANLPSATLAGIPSYPELLCSSQPKVMGLAAPALNNYIISS
jgi:hypothetical protein